MSSLPTSSSSSDGPEPATPFDALDRMRCPVTVVLGTGSITVRQCLALERHSILRLAQSAGEELSILVNGVTLARGEVAIIDTSTAIRLTELSPAQAGLRGA